MAARGKNNKMKARERNVGRNVLDVMEAYILSFFFSRCIFVSGGGGGGVAEGVVCRTSSHIHATHKYFSSCRLDIPRQ